MAKLDRAKEYIGFLKAVFVILVAIDSSFIAWLFNNPKLNFDSSLVIMCICISSIVIILLVKHILKKIVELEEIE